MEGERREGSGMEACTHRIFESRRLCQIPLHYVIEYAYCGRNCKDINRDWAAGRESLKSTTANVHFPSINRQYSP